MSDFYKVQPLTDFSIFTTPRSQRKSVQFKASWPTTVDDLEYELVHLGGRDVVMEIGVSAADLRIDGTLRANARPQHPGVRLSFQTRKHGALSYTCDTYEQQYYIGLPSWQANVRAIVKTLEALRAVDRYGATKGEQYAGFKALPAGNGGIALGGMTRDQALEILGAASGIPGEHLNTAPDSLRLSWRRARRDAHPDKHAGDQTAWDRIEEAAKVLGLTS